MIQAPAVSTWFQHVSRGFAVAVSTGAALVSIGTALYSYGVVGHSESHQSIGNVGAAWVRLRPAADTATAIGDTVRFAATIADRKGSVLIGAAPTWTIGDSSVAAIGSDGSVIARGPGSTTVTVVVGSIVASARVVVSPQVASVVVDAAAGDTAASIPEGAHLQLHARPLDARGHLVAGRAPTWRSDDSTVASVDAHGVLTGQGAGRGLVSVRVDGATGSLPVTVLVTPAALAAVAGADQHALAGHPLPQRVVVRATDRKGGAVAGKLVTFRLAGAQGKVEPATATTDADGRVRAQWTLGDDPGQQRLLASIESLDTTITLLAESEPVSHNTRVTPLAEAVSGRAGSVLVDSVGVRVTDSTGRALAGVPVRWDAAHGTVQGLEPRTDSSGIARARWALGPASGTQRLRVFVGSTDSHVPPAIIAASALAGPPARSLVVSGDRQRAAAGEALPQPVVLRVVDGTGNGAAGVEVSLTPSDGSVRDTTLVTDSTGTVRARWTMGHSAGEHALAVRVAGIDKLLKVSARAVPARPANLSFDDAPAAHPARSGEARLVAHVTDVYGNPVPDAPVTFKVKSGTVTPARAVTDAHGGVAVRWTMGASRADLALTGSVRGTDVSGAWGARPAEGDAAKPVASKAVSSKARRGTR